MRPTRLIPLAAVAVLAAACSTGGGSPATASAAPSAPAATSVAATRVDVTLSDALKIDPAAMTVPAGQPVTFVVTNKGTVLHEFVLGDEAAQMAHDKEMADAGGMSMPKDEPMAIGVEPGKTKELTVTFDEAGQVLAGCHVVGHYAAGMKAAITVE
jgi:uncharacterized cupredoxin-like copper-binding protein